MSLCSGYIGADQLDAALKGCEVVVIPAGVPRKPGTAQQIQPESVKRRIKNYFNEMRFEMFLH